jgi:hypothetical protein
MPVGNNNDKPAAWLVMQGQEQNFPIDIISIPDRLGKSKLLENKTYVCLA